MARLNLPLGIPVMTRFANGQRQALNIAIFAGRHLQHGLICRRASLAELDFRMSVSTWLDISTGIFDIGRFADGYSSDRPID